MTVDLQERAGNVLVVHASGKLSRQDYQELGPLVERMIRDHGRIRVLFDMRDFHGWQLGALWEDVKFDAKHYHDIERLAIVGESRWQEGMSRVCKPFTSAEIRYFPRDRVDEAQAWIEEPAPRA